MDLLRLKELLNHLWVGIVSGIILPILIYFIFVHPRYKGFSLTGVEYNQMMALLIPILMSRCIFPNVIVFFLFIWREMNYAAKGVLYSSMGLVGLLYLLKLIAKQI